MVRHVRKFKLSHKKALSIRYFKYENDDSDRRHEIQEWAVDIGVSHVPNIFNMIGPFTHSDLLRLRRVVNRAIKIVEKQGL